jgi:hypothetical protein
VTFSVWSIQNYRVIISVLAAIIGDSLIIQS